MARKKLISANWKMYKDPSQTKDFFGDFLPLIAGRDRDEVVVCPPYIDLHAAMESAKGSQIAIGAQDVYWKDEGAFTGEISSGMLVAIGCTHVIIGHSERRQYFAETDDTVNLKLKAALEHGLTPIVCVGEVLEEREAGLTEDVLRRQCVRAFHTHTRGSSESFRAGVCGWASNSLWRFSEAGECEGANVRRRDRWCAGRRS